jgi:hypothetical protein
MSYHGLRILLVQFILFYGESISNATHKELMDLISWS